MRERGERMAADVHRLARTYHWSEGGILSLSLPRRQRYLRFVEQDDRAALAQQLEEA
jgi:hypothetical protein